MKIQLFFKLLLLLLVYFQAQAQKPYYREISGLESNNSPEIQYFSGIHLQRLPGHVYFSSATIHFRYDLLQQKIIPRLENYKCPHSTQICGIFDNIRSQISLIESMLFHSSFSFSPIQKLRRSAPLPIIGEINHALFGLADEETIYSIHQTENHLTNAMQQLKNNLLSEVNYTMHQATNLNHFKNDVEESFHRINQVLNNTIAKLNDNQRNAVYYPSVFIQEIAHALHLATAVNSENIVKTACQTKFLPHSIISTTELRAELKLLQAQLAQHGFVPLFQDNNVLPYFQSKLLSCITQPKVIEMILKIPVRLQSENIHVYRLIPIPIGHHNKTYTIQPPSSIAMTYNGNIIPISESDVISCGLLTNHLCHLDIRPSDQGSIDRCLHFLLNGGSQSDARHCTYSIQDSTDTQLTYINSTNLYITYPPPDTRVICGYSNRSEADSLTFHHAATFKRFASNFTTYVILPCNCHLENLQVKTIISKLPCPQYQKIELIHQVPLIYSTIDYQISSSRIQLPVDKIETFQYLPAIYDPFTNVTFETPKIDFNTLKTFPELVTQHWNTLNYISLSFDILFLFALFIFAYYLHHLYWITVILSQAVPAQSQSHDSFNQLCYLPVYLEAFINVIILYLFIVLTVQIVRILRKYKLPINRFRSTNPSRRTSTFTANQDQHEIRPILNDQLPLQNLQFNEYSRTPLTNKRLAEPRLNITPQYQTIQQVRSASAEPSGYHSLPAFNRNRHQEDPELSDMFP